MTLKQPLEKRVLGETGVWHSEDQKESFASKFHKSSATHRIHLHCQRLGNVCQPCAHIKSKSVGFFFFLRNQYLKNTAEILGLLLNKVQRDFAQQLGLCVCAHAELPEASAEFPMPRTTVGYTETTQACWRPIPTRSLAYQAIQT